MTSSTSSKAEFSPLRAFFWPVHAYELKKLIPMLLIFFFINFDYNILRTMKDTLVVTAKGSGAEVIPFIKVWVMFPGAILLTFLFTRLSNSFRREMVFYVMLSIFLSYFALFTLVLYPNRDALHPHALADRMQEVLPLGFKGVIAMFRYWTFTLFYAMSELWSSTILAMLFWGFANQVTRLNEAKRFYGLFGIGANFSGVAAGMSSVYICKRAFDPNLPGQDAWEQSMMLLICLVLAAGVVAMLLFRWMHTSVLTDERHYDSTQMQRLEEKSAKMSMRDNIAYLLKSPYLLYIAIIVVAYNIVINLVEVVWKHQVKELYPNPADYNLYMNHVTTIIGILATLTALFVSGNSIRKFGWTFTAMLTPGILFFTSIGFFTFFFLKGSSIDFTYSFLNGTTPLAMVVFFGSAQNILSRGAKYTVFDATKEMAFIPLNAECKLKGKSVIDGVGSRLGKSSGAFIHQTLLLYFSTITASAPYVAGFLLVTIGVWGSAVWLLGKKFNSMTTESPSSQEEETKHVLLSPNTLTTQQAT